jgi:hypothetical protein
MGASDRAEYASVPLMRRSKSAASRVRATLHGVVFDIFVSGLPCTAEGTLRWVHALSVAHCPEGVRRPCQASRTCW